MEIGLKIKELRIKKKLTPLQLSQKMGVTRDLVYQYESNKTTPPIEKLEILSKCLDVDASYFVSNKSEKQNKSEIFTNVGIEEKPQKEYFYNREEFLEFRGFLKGLLPSDLWEKVLPMFPKFKVSKFA